MESKVWFITGASRGIGAEIAKAALKAGHKVVATSRDPMKVEKALGGPSDRLLTLPLDVTMGEQASDAVEAAISRFGRIDILINNAGYGQLGVFEETTPRQVREQFETNVFGLMTVTRTVLPHMRKRRSGRILNISSVAGLKGLFGGSIYCASKFAVEGFSEALAQELEPFGILVTSVCPGYFRTDFLDKSSLRMSEENIRDYESSMGQFRDFMDGRNHEQLGDPVKLAEAIVLLAEAEHPPVTFVAGSDAMEWAEQSAKELEKEVDDWRELSAGTSLAYKMNVR
jgi:NAD(P)-dependent dehydrogenase (short-subunit alcohol dehydrogenase family)